MSKLIAIDGNSLLFRAYFAMPPMKRSSDGQPTGAVYGFMNMLFSIIEEYEPTHIAVAFDRKEPTFRHLLFDKYKAGRRKTDPELLSQFPVLKKTLSELGITVLEQAGSEADDILGTLARMSDEKNETAYLLTGDKDALQLISGNTTVLLTRKGVSEIEKFDEAHLREVYDLAPSQIVDLKALMGDSSDNIPGIKGIGEKTALKLLHQFGTVDGLYAGIDSLPANKTKQKIIDGQADAEMSHMLAKIDTHVPILSDLETLKFDGFDEAAITRALTELEFKSLLKRRGLSMEQKSLDTTEIADLEGLKHFVAEASECKCIAVYLKSDVIYFAGDDKHETAVVLGDSLSREDALSELKPLLENKDVEKLTHGAKDTMAELMKDGVSLAGVAFDTMLAAYTLNPTLRSFDLEKIASKYAAPGNAGAVFAISAAQKKELEQHGLHEVYYGIELPLTFVLFDMECEGFKVDIDKLAELSRQYEQATIELQEAIYALAGHEFNIASTKQLGTVLFEELGLPVIKKTKRGYSTDIEVLERLENEHPMIPLIIEYRRVTKLKSTYIDALQSKADEEHKIHTTFMQTATATGRISSVEPNLQNIPVRSELSAHIRSVFLPSREDGWLVSADYSQIELRVLAALSGDEHMKDAFLKDEDIHTRTAAQVFAVRQDEVTHEMRSSAKAVNFGIVYGISDFGLAKQLGIPRFKAAEYIEKYLSEFSGVREYMHNAVEQAKKDGYARTLFGRLRYIDELSSSNYNVRSFGERAAMNTPVQGTAADIIKKAMNEVYLRIKNQGLKAKLILQVHDELIVDTPADEVEQVKNVLSDVMQNICPELGVPLSVSVASGRTWAQAK
ncbi:MAG: DNA polymerase I [Christensenellaceae bacterium]